MLRQLTRHITHTIATTSITKVFTSKNLQIQIRQYKTNTKFKTQALLVLEKNMATTTTTKTAQGPEKSNIVDLKKTNELERHIVFVLGGPGSGKGTQCIKLINEYDIVHLSAGELLRTFTESGSPEGNMVQKMMIEGKIVPSEITVRLLDEAMVKSGKTQFLIDGFPRNVENQQAFINYMKKDCEFVLFFDCPEEILEGRLMSRKEGRSDDNLATIKKRFNVFMTQTMEVINHYASKDMVRRVDASLSVSEVFNQVKSYFSSFKKLPISL